MCHLQLRSLVFAAWVLGYVAFLLALRRMWTGRYVRSPAVRFLLTNMMSESETAVPETQEVRRGLWYSGEFLTTIFGWIVF